MWDAIEAYAGTGAALHQHLVPRVDEFANSRGHQTHSILMNLDLLGYADFHKLAPLGWAPGWQGYSHGRPDTILVSSGDTAQFLHQQTLPKQLLAGLRRSQ